MLYSHYQEDSVCNSSISTVIAMENQESIAADIEKTAKLLEEEINDENQDRVQTYLWNLENQFDKLKNLEFDYLRGSTNEDRKQASLKKFKEVETFVQDLKNAAETYLADAHQFHSIMHDISPEVKAESQQNASTDKEKHTAPSENSNTTFCRLPMPTLGKISTIRTNNTTSYMRPILQQYASIRLPGCSAKVTYTSNEPTVFTAP